MSGVVNFEIQIPGFFKLILENTRCISSFSSNKSIKDNTFFSISGSNFIGFFAFHINSDFFGM